MSDRGKFWFYATCLGFDNNLKITKNNIPIRFADIINTGMLKKESFLYPSIYFLIIAIRNYHDVIIERRKIFVDAKTYGYISKFFLQIPYLGFDLDAENNMLDFYREGLEHYNKFSIFLFKPRSDSENFAKLIRSKVL